MKNRILLLLVAGWTLSGIILNGYFTSQLKNDIADLKKLYESSSPTHQVEVIGWEDVECRPIWGVSNSWGVKKGK